MNDEDSTVSQQVDDFPPHKMEIIPDVRYRFELNKTKHRVRIPREEETEDRVVVYIEPKE